LLLLVGLAIPACAASDLQMKEQVTAAQLEQILARNYGKQDDDMKRLIYGLQLTERLSARRQALAEALLPGPGSRLALTGISDEATFLNLPAQDLLAVATPDHAAQFSLLTLAVGYANQTIHLLPNFFATRQTFNFEAKPWKQNALPQQAITRDSLFLAGASSLTVFYHDGREFKQNKAGKEVKDDPSQLRLETNGEFGPILSTVLGDALHGKIGWGHWEQGPLGPMAVFRYSVAKELSHYSVFYPDSRREKREVPAYHGEIAINPADGSILRITVLADFEPSDPNVKANLLVEYGSVEIGNRRYICPVKSVALSVVRNPKTNAFLPLFFKEFSPAGSSSLRMRINNVRFIHYHLFRAESRILTEEEAAREIPPGPDAVPAANPAESSKP
jgi:hypothetical protein